MGEDGLTSSLSNLAKGMQMAGKVLYGEWEIDHRTE